MSCELMIGQYSTTEGVQWAHGRSILIYLILIYFPGTGLKRVWGIYLIYSFWMALRWVWGIFIPHLFPWHGSEAGLRNIYISFVSLQRVWVGSEEYLYLIYSFWTGLRRVWGIFIPHSFPLNGCMAGLTNISHLFLLNGSEAGLRNIYIYLKIN